MYRKPNYVMAGANYSIGFSTYNPFAPWESVEKQSEFDISDIVAPVPDETSITDYVPDAPKPQTERSREIVYAAVGAGVGFLASKNPVGAIIGAAIGFFAPKALEAVGPKEPPMLDDINGELEESF